MKRNHNYPGGSLPRTAQSTDTEGKVQVIPFHKMEIRKFIHLLIKENDPYWNVFHGGLMMFGAHWLTAHSVLSPDIKQTKK
jgi:hypothetical protein